MAVAMHWTRECARMMNHTTTRAHIGDETGLAMLRALNDRFDMQVQQVVHTMRPDNGMTVLNSPTAIGATMQGTYAATSTRTHSAQPLTPENLRSMALLQDGECQPSPERAQAFFIHAPSARLECTPEQRSRIDAMLHICRGESIIEVARLTQIPLHSLKSMCAVFNQSGAQTFITYIRMRY